MCIIAIKPKNKEIQKKEILKNCFTRNSDGAGYMFVKDNEVVIKKGFMTFDEFYTSVMKDYTDNHLKNSNLVMHFRIGTSGESKLGCTHPFPLTDNYTDLEKLRTKANIGVCHNGIVSGMNSRLNKYSDTEIYIKNVLAPIVKLKINAYLFKDIQNLILLTTNSKWCILDKFDNMVTIGEFVENDGYYYSNDTYKPYIPPKYDYSDYYSSGYYDWFKLKSHKDAKTTLSTSSATSVKPSKTTPIKQHNSDMISVRPIEKGSHFIETRDNKTTFTTNVDTNGVYYYDKTYNVYKYTDGKYVEVVKHGLIYTKDNALVVWS